MFGVLLKFYFNNAVITILKNIALYTWEYAHMYTFISTYMSLSKKKTTRK